jgi:signal transduction histidine kinase
MLSCHPPERNDNEVRVTIKDTGSGINPKIFPKLFSKFSSAPLVVLD